MTWTVSPVYACCLVQSLFVLQLVLTEALKGCPKLKFLSLHGCQPCSLCKPGINETDRLVRKECLYANPKPVPDGRRLWCDNSNGPFPECPQIHNSALLGQCTDSCKAQFRKFAPGCMCTVGCLGQVPRVILCTENLLWNNTDIPLLCSPPTTIAGVDDEILPVNKVADDIVLPIALGAAVFVIILGITVAIIGTCLYRRLRAKLCPPQSSTLTDTNSTSPLLESSLEAKSSQLPASQNGSGPDTYPANGSVIISIDARETPHSVAVNSGTETDAVQYKEAGNKKEQMDSYRALDALLKNREHLIKLTRMFDQEHEFDKITWHDMAVDLVRWDRHRVRNTECNKSGCQNISSPVDGPMYSVLEDARQQGKGLLDLVACLQQQRFRSKESEEFLLQFWHEWTRSQQTFGAHGPC